MGHEKSSLAQPYMGCGLGLGQLTKINPGRGAWRRQDQLQVELGPPRIGIAKLVAQESASGVDKEGAAIEGG